MQLSLQLFSNVALKNRCKCSGVKHQALQNEGFYK